MRTRSNRVAISLLLVCGVVSGCEQSTAVPAPADVIGFAPGEDYKLADYGPIAEYFEALAASTAPSPFCDKSCAAADIGKAPKENAPKNAAAIFFP